MSWVYCGVSRLLQVPSISITTDIFFVVTINVAREIEWIAKGSKDPSVDPPRPEEVMADISLRSDTDRYTKFASRMICAYLRE